MSDEKYVIKNEFPWQVTFGDSLDTQELGTQDPAITFFVQDKERLKVTKDSFYVEGRLVANDTEIYQALQDFLNSCSGKETQDDRYYKAIRRHIEKEESNGDE